MVHHPNMNCKVSNCEEEKGSYPERTDFALQEISLLQAGPQFVPIDGEYSEENDVSHEHDEMGDTSNSCIFCFIWSKKDDVCSKEQNES